MPLQNIPIPESIKSIPHTRPASRLIDAGYRRIEEYLLAVDEVPETFVNCDFHLVDQSLTWIHDNHLVTGDRFLEWGSGFGLVTMLAALRRMDAVGIEIEPSLVDQSGDFAMRVASAARFFCGSFVPRDMPDLEDLGAEFEHVHTDAGDVYAEIGLDPDDFDLFFAFPWPGEHAFFESIFDASAASGALLLTYRGREGMHLVRKK